MSQNQETVVISKQEYDYLCQIVIDMGDVVTKMDDLATLFQNSGISRMQKKMDIVKELVRNPKGFDDLSKNMIPMIMEFGPYVNKYSKLKGIVIDKQNEHVSSQE